MPFNRNGRGGWAGGSTFVLYPGTYSNRGRGPSSSVFFINFSRE